MLCLGTAQNRHTPVQAALMTSPVSNHEEVGMAWLASARGQPGMLAAKTSGRRDTGQ